MKKKKPDPELDTFLDHPDFDEDEVAGNYMDCPRCGSDWWEWLITDKRGRTVGCTECRGVVDN